MRDTTYEQKQTYGYMALVELLRLAFRSPDSAKRVVSDLVPDDMPDIDHKRIYTILEEQVSTSKVSLFALEAKLAEFMGAEPAYHLINKIEGTKPLNEEYTKLIEYIKTATKWRLFSDVSYEMGDWHNIKDIDTDLGDWIPRLQAVMDTATDPTSTTDAIQDLLPEFVRETQRLMSLDHDITGFETGYKQLDEAINGLEPATITVIGAKTSIGKSLVGLNLAVGAMLRKHHGIDRSPKCTVFTLEMSKQQVVRRICANVGGVAFDLLKKPKGMKDDDLSRFTAGTVKMKQLPLTIVEGGKTVEQICGEARRLHIKGQLDFMVIDHLHNIRYTGNGSPQQEIKHITGRLVDLKNELNIPILLLAQCNRAAGTDKAPTKENLEGAGAIEQDADNIIMLHRADKYLDPSDTSLPRTNVIELISGKEREGEPFYIKYGFDGRHQRMVENHWDLGTPFDGVIS